MSYESVLQLNKYPADRYNVLVPVTTMQAASNLQRIVVSEVQLDTRQDNTNRGPSKDIYFEKSSGAFAITKVGGMKLAAAANISIVDTTPARGLRGAGHRLAGALLRGAFRTASAAAARYLLCRLPQRDHGGKYPERRGLDAGRHCRVQSEGFRTNPV